MLLDVPYNCPGFAQSNTFRPGFAWAEGIAQFKGRYNSITRYLLGFALVLTNVCKKHEKSNIRPVLSLQDSSGTCPEVPPGPEGQARPDLCPTFEYSGYLVFPRDLNYFCIANLNGYLANYL